MYLGLSGSGSKTFPIPAGALKPNAQNILAVLLRNMGHSEDFLANDSHKSPRGLTSATVDGSNASIAWRIQGTQGGETPVDAVRGLMNDGGLYGERTGWYLPGYPDGNWSPVALPHTETQPGVSWYRTTFSLSLPSGQDSSLALKLTDDPARVYRAQIFVNGWNMGQYINNVGPQTVFPIPNGILRPNGQNTIAIASWGGDSGGGLGMVSLVDLSTGAGGVSVADVDSPGYVSPTLTADSISATAGAPFSGPVATVAVPAGAQASAFAATISWGDGTTSPGTIAGNGPNRTVGGSHVYAAAGRYTVNVTLTDRYDASVLAHATGTATVHPLADLSVTNTDAPDPVHVGQSLTYTMSVTNVGPDPAAGVTLELQLPKNAGYGTPTTTQGSCSLKTDKRLLSCSLGQFAGGGSATVTLVVKPSARGTISSTASVKSSTLDPVQSNNTSTASTLVLP